MRTHSWVCSNLLNDIFTSRRKLTKILRIELCELPARGSNPSHWKSSLGTIRDWDLLFRVLIFVQTSFWRQSTQYRHQSSRIKKLNYKSWIKVVTLKKDEIFLLFIVVNRSISASFILPDHLQKHSPSRYSQRQREQKKRSSNKNMEML